MKCGASVKYCPQGVHAIQLSAIKGVFRTLKRAAGKEFCIPEFWVHIGIDICDKYRQKECWQEPDLRQSNWRREVAVQMPKSKNQT